jgi:ATP-binding cassette subfamily B protein
LSTVPRADRLVGLDHGRLVGVWTPAVLRRRGGLYAKLVPMQWTARDNVSDALAVIAAAST